MPSAPKPTDLPTPTFVLFDAAGTLFELRRSVGETYSEFASRYGVELPAWRLDDAFARVMRSAEPMVFPDAAPGDVDALERNWWRTRVRQVLMATDSTARFPDTGEGSPGFDAWFDALWEEFGAESAWRLREGCADALAELRAAGLGLGVASNFDHRLDSLLEGFGIHDFFDVIERPGTSRVAKPASGLFEAALAAVGTSADRACYVGDDPEIDGAAAAACGMRFIDVETLGSMRELPARIQAS